MMMFKKNLSVNYFLFIIKTYQYNTCLFIDRLVKIFQSVLKIIIIKEKRNMSPFSDKIRMVLQIIVKKYNSPGNLRSYSICNLLYGK